MEPERERVQDESMKLLVQLAWSDGELSDAEIRILSRLAAGSGASKAFVESLPLYLGGEVPLPAPDLGLLKRFRPGVLALADVLLHADGVHCDREREVREMLERLLS